MTVCPCTCTCTRCTLICIHVHVYMSVCVSVNYAHTNNTGTVAVAVDEKRNNLMEFGRYVQEILPKFVQHAQITHRYMYVKREDKIQYWSYKYM